MDSSQEQSRSDTRTRYVLWNALSQIGFMVISVLVNLWYVPFIVGRLGVALYGLIPLATSIVFFLSFVTGGLTGSVGRFLTIDLVREDSTASLVTFNTALFGMLSLMAVFIPATVVISWFAPTLFRVPAGFEADGRWLFVAVFFAFLIGAVRSIFAVSTFARNMLFLEHINSLVQLLVRVSLVVVLFVMFSPRLYYVGLAVLIAVTVNFLLTCTIWRRLTPELMVRIARFSLQRFRDLVGMSWWLVLNQVGNLLIMNSGIVVANIILGPKPAGELGILLVLFNLLVVFSDVITKVLYPVVVAKYATQDFAAFEKLAHKGVKFLGLTMALPVGLLCVLSKPLLTVWLDHSFEHLGYLLVLLVTHLCVNLAVRPLLAFEAAFNKVRWPGVVTIMVGIMNVTLAIVFTKALSWGLWGIVIPAVIAMTLRNTVFTPAYVAHIMGLPRRSFFLDLRFGVVGVSVVGLITYLMSSVYVPRNWLHLGTIVLTVSFIYLLMTYLFMLSSQDKQLLKNLVLRSLRQQSQ